MHEEMILEIPEQTDEMAEWEPPVLKNAEIPENKKRSQSCADIFFIQYIICILLLTALFSVRLLDEQIFQHTIYLFQEYTHAESEPWILSLIEQGKQIWN